MNTISQKEKYKLSLRIAQFVYQSMVIKFFQTTTESENGNQITIGCSYSVVYLNQTLKLLIMLGI